MASTHPTDPLERFHPAVSAWFRAAFTVPTAVQEQARTHIAEGLHALITAPT